MLHRGWCSQFYNAITDRILKVCVVCRIPCCPSSSYSGNQGVVSWHDTEARSEFWELQQFSFYNVCPTVNFVLLLENFLEAAAEGTLQMAEIFFTAFMVDNNILDIFLIKCELCCMIKLARHLWSKITNVKSNSSNVSVNKYTGDSQHATAPSSALFKELLHWHWQCFGNGLTFTPTRIRKPKSQIANYSLGV